MSNIKIDRYYIIWEYEKTEKHILGNWCKIKDVQKLQEKAERKWISVLNKLPGDECEVLSYTKEGYISVDYYDIDMEMWDGGGNVTHWMPRPEPPKDK